jgi:hypothetical protein
MATKPRKPAKTTKHAGRIAASSSIKHRTPGGAFKHPPGKRQPPPDRTQKLAKAGTLPGDEPPGRINANRVNPDQMPGEWPDEPGE